MIGPDLRAPSMYSQSISVANQQRCRPRRQARLFRTVFDHEWYYVRHRTLMVIHTYERTSTVRYLPVFAQSRSICMNRDLHLFLTDTLGYDLPGQIRCVSFVHSWHGRCRESRVATRDPIGWIFVSTTKNAYSIWIYIYATSYTDPRTFWAYTAYSRRFCLKAIAGSKCKRNASSRPRFASREVGGMCLGHVGTGVNARRPFVAIDEVLRLVFFMPRRDSDQIKGLVSR